MIYRKSTIRLLAAAAFLIIARLVFDLTSATAYAYPEFDFGQNGIAFVVFILAVPAVLVLALVRLFQRRFPAVILSDPKPIDVPPLTSRPATGWLAAILTVIFKRR